MGGGVQNIFCNKNSWNLDKNIKTSLNFSAGKKARRKVLVLQKSWEFVFSSRENIFGIFRIEKLVFKTIKDTKVDDAAREVVGVAKTHEPLAQWKIIQNTYASPLSPPNYTPFQPPNYAPGTPQSIFIFSH